MHSVWRDRGRDILVRLLGLTVCMLILASAGSASAHVFSTNRLDIIGFGNTGVISVSDPSGCSALIHAEVEDPDIASVDPMMIDAVSHDFVVTAGTKAGLTHVVFTWVGETYPQPPCNEQSSHEVTVVVRDIAEFVPDSSANNDQSGTVGDPVNTFNGELYFHAAADLALPGPMQLEMRRYYASYLRRSFVVGSLGDNWRHGFEWDLRNVGNFLVLVDDRGRVINFHRNGGFGAKWEQQTRKDVPYQVVQDMTVGSHFSVLDPRDNRIYVFDVPPGASLIKLVEIQDGRGNALALSYDTAAVLQQVTDGAGRTLTFSYATDGHLASVSDGTRAVSYVYTGEDLTGFTDARGFSTGYEYDTTHPDPALLVRTTLPRGNVPYVQTYDDLGRVATQSDAAGNTFTFDYSVAGMTTVTDPAGAVRVYIHRDDGSLLSVQDGLGNVLSIDNDETGRRIGVLGAAGATTALGYDPASGRVASISDTRGDQVAYAYSTRAVGASLMAFDRNRIDYPDGTSETFTYDAAGNRIAQTDRSGATWSMTYDTGGRMTSRTNPLGGTTSYTYDSAGRLTSQTDAAGNTTSFAYDAVGRLVAVTRPDGSVRSQQYDAAGLLVSFTDEDGATTTYTYDANGNVVSATDATGGTWTYGYDGNDRRVSITDRTGQVFALDYDSYGRLTSISSGGQTIAYTYDAAGRLSTITDPSGADWTHAYDAAGNLIARGDPLGGNRTLTLDADGFVTAQTSAAGATTQFETDALGRVTQLTDPLGQVTKHVFDANGTLSAIELADGARATYRHNALGLLEELVAPNGGTWRYAYDGGGRLISATDPVDATTTYAHDVRNRLSRVSFAGGGTLDVTYNGRGDVLRRTYSDGVDLAYTYDALGRLTTADGLSLAYDAEGHVTASNGLAVTRDAAGRVVSLELAPGKTITYSYDAAGRPTGVSDWLGGGVSFGVDAAGRQTELQRDNGLVTMLAYDADGRLASMTDGATSALAMTRDGRGRVTINDRALPLAFMAMPGEDVSFTYDAAYRLSTASYDGQGRTLDDGVRSYTWDLASRLTGYEEGGTAVAFTYDGFGELLSRTQAGVTRTYVWNHALGLPVVSVVRDDAVDTTYYVHAVDGSLLYAIDAVTGAHRYYHYDEAGNTLYVSGDDGIVVEQFAYDPYGAMISSSSTTTELFTFGGRWGVMREGTSGLYRMRARLYDCRAMRFLSRDPQQPHIDPINVDPYAYAAGDPITNIDPLGEAPTAAANAGGTPTDLIEPVNGMINNTGGALGVVTDAIAAKAGSADFIAEVAAAKAKADDVSSINRATQAIKNAERWKKINDIAQGEEAAGRLGRLGRAGQAIGVAGNVATFIDLGFKANALDDQLDASRGAYAKNAAQVQKSYDMCREHAWRLFHDKRISEDVLRAKLETCQAQIALDLYELDTDFYVDVARSSAAFYGNTLGGFIPFNPVSFDPNGAHLENPFASLIDAIGKQFE